MDFKIETDDWLNVKTESYTIL